MISTYEAYISSNYWVQLRKKCIERDTYCRTCGSTNTLEVHHVKYPPVLYIKDEQMYADWSLDSSNHHILLCKECHEAITSVIRGRRYEKRDISCDAHKIIVDRNYNVEHSISILDAVPIQDSGERVYNYHGKFR